MRIGAFAPRTLKGRTRYETVQCYSSKKKGRYGHVHSRPCCGTGQGPGSSGMGTGTLGNEKRSSAGLCLTSLSGVSSSSKI